MLNRQKSQLLPEFVFFHAPRDNVPGNVEVKTAKVVFYDLSPVRVEFAKVESGLNCRFKARFKERFQWWSWDKN
ncbi:hypothetical protein D3C83_129990 [compost metagenome]